MNYKKKFRKEIKKANKRGRKLIARLQKQVHILEVLRDRNEFCSEDRAMLQALLLVIDYNTVYKVGDTLPDFSAVYEKFEGESDVVSISRAFKW